MPLVVARLGRHGHDAGAPPELGGEGAGQHLELADGLDGGLHDHRVERELVVVDAVDQPCVGVGGRAEGVEVRGAARVEGGLAGEVLAGLPGSDAGREVDERREVAAVERQLAHRALLDHLAHLGGVGARERGEADHLGRLGHAADFERRVHARALVDLQHDAAVDVLAEARELDRHLVAAGDQERRREGAAGVGGVDRGGALSHLGDRHACARDGRSLLVPHGPEDGAGGDLRMRAGGLQDRCSEQDEKDDRRRVSSFRLGHEAPPCHSAAAADRSAAPNHAGAGGGWRLRSHLAARLVRLFD